MFLKQIHIENYRLLMEYDIVFDRRLTLLVGKNNTGKTGILKAIRAALGNYPVSQEDLNEKNQNIHCF